MEHFFVKNPLVTCNNPRAALKIRKERFGR